MGMDESPAENVSHGVDPDAVRQRAYELSQQHPDATDEENWLVAEAELAAAAAKVEHDERTAAEAAADLMASIELSVYGHS
jgi:hypothetical protein